MIEPGQYRNQVSIEKYTTTRGTGGQPVKTYAVEATRRAYIEDLSGTEYVNVKQVNAELTHLVKMRYYDLSPKDRLDFGGRKFEIVEIKNIGQRNHEIHLLVKEIL